MGVPVERLNKIGEGSPHVVDWIERGDVDLVDQHADRLAARAPTARRSAAPRSRAGSRASPRCPAALAAARAIARRRAAARPTVLSLQELHGAGAAAREAPGDVSATARARSRRFGRRALRRSARPRESAPTACSRAADPDGPAPAAGPVLHARRRRAVGGGGGRAPVPAARVLGLRAARRRRPASSCSRTSARAPRGSRELAPGRAACGLLGPLGHRLRGRRATAARALLVRRRHRRRAAGDLAGRAARAGAPAPALLGFRDAAHAAAAALLARRRASPPTTARPAITASSPSCSRAELDGDRGARRSTPAGRRAMLEAVRALCAERDVPAQLALESRRWPAASAPASAASCRRATAATCGCASTGRCSTADLETWLERTDGRRVTVVELLRARARAPGHQRLGHLRRDRRAPRVRRRAARALPVRGVRLQDDHARRRARATRRRGCGRRRPG